MTNPGFCIKSGYQERPFYVQFDDRPNTDEWQDEVYAEARRIFDENRLSNVLDFGCGSGFKLLKYFKDVPFVGLELEPNLSFLRKSYPGYSWSSSDLNNPPKLDVDLFISADVIEHLLDPNVFLNYIRAINPKWIVLSTPDRDLVHGELHLGPPPNPHHVREWNRMEFKSYLGQWFEVVAQKAFKKGCQAAICRPRGAKPSLPLPSLDPIGLLR